MIDFEHFLFEVFGSNTPNNNKIYGRLLYESRYKIKHPITCEKPSAYYKRIGRVELINGDPEKEITLVGSQESGSLFFVSSNKTPSTGEVNRIWTDSNNIYNLSWLGPNCDYILFSIAHLDSSLDITEITVNLFNKKTLSKNSVRTAEGIAKLLSKRELVKVMDSDILPDDITTLTTDNCPISYSSILDNKLYTSRILPKTRHKKLKNMFEKLKRLGN